MEESMTDYSGLFAEKAEGPSITAIVEQETDRFLSALKTARPNNIDFVKEEGCGQEGVSWTVTFKNNSGTAMGQLQLAEADLDKDGKPDFMMMTMVDTQGGLVGLRTDSFEALVEKAVADNLEAWKSQFVGHGRKAHFISGVQGFADVQPASLASFLVQVSDSVAEQRPELRVSAPAGVPLGKLGG
jgi:hypothetical protein